MVKLTIAQLRRLINEAVRSNVDLDSYEGELAELSSSWTRYNFDEENGEDWEDFAATMNDEYGIPVPAVKKALRHLWYLHNHGDPRNHYEVAEAIERSMKDAKAALKRRKATKGKAQAKQWRPLRQTVRLTRNRWH